MDARRALINALRSLLRPVVKLLLQLGFSFRDFSEIAKTIYVEVASEEYGIRGRKTNISRVAILTGLTRREVSRLRHVVDREPTVSMDQSNSVSKILSAWHQHQQFLDENGQPKVLPISGACSFQTLLETYGGDIPHTALSKELERVAAIKLTKSHVTVLRRVYVPFFLEAQAISRFGSVLNDVGQTITQNLIAGRRNEMLFERRALNERIPLREFENFRIYVAAKGQVFLEEIDDWLTAHEADSQDETMTRMGIGAYLISTELESHR